MQVVQQEDVERKRGLEHRGGTFYARTLVHGTPGTPGNFKLSLSESGADHSGPRHRHNFDQFRFMIRGASSFDRDGVLKEGMLGYFPEGVHYGPQTNPSDTFLIVLQFGGASGSGYLLPWEVKAGTEELRKFGEFKDGVFYRGTGEGKKQVDGFQAVWEHVYGRDMEYPKPRYDAPVFMDPANFDWIPVAEGVEEKLLGTFTERRCEGGLLRLAADAQHRVRGRGLWTVLSGAGATGDKVLNQYTCVFLETGEEAVLEASETMVLLHYGLPDLRGLESARPVSAVAAE
jgi:hypothetical protein